MYLIYRNTLHECVYNIRTQTCSKRELKTNNEQRNKIFEKKKKCLTPQGIEMDRINVHIN